MDTAEKFRQIRRIVAVWKFALEQIQDIKNEHDSAMDKLVGCLEDLESHAKEKGIDLELCHLMNFAGFLDDRKMESIRKKILDHGNALRREAEGETETF